MFIWGAGKLCEKAIEIYGDRINAIIDNSPQKQGKLFHGYRVISYEDYLLEDVEDKSIVICASRLNTIDIQDQLKKYGNNDFLVLELQLFESVDLVYNQYEQFEGRTEQDWYNRLESDGSKDIVNRYVKKISEHSIPLFNEIEIETVNKCNGACSFCPVSRNNDIRKTEYMSEGLFKKIIDELNSINFSGRIALFSNNEPLLDERLLPFSKYTREKLPKAQIHLFTNGTLLTVEIFDELIKYLDELIIDNYNQELNLIPTVKKIKEHVESLNDKAIRKKVKILLRKPNEYLSSRGGDAPNRHTFNDVSKDTCALPFCQMIVRPSGKVSLCCNDPYGRETLGDLSKENLLDVWYGEKYNEVRNKIKTGRQALKHCAHCDTFMII